MKTDLVTSIGIAIVGVFVAYFCCSFLFGSDDTFKYSINTIDESTASSDLESPNVDVFNYKALNPTVEVYVGNCKNTDGNGKCLDDSEEEIQNGLIDEDENTEQENTAETNDQLEPNDVDNGEE